METQLIKIKILFTIPNFDTAGSGNALLNVAKNLDKSRFEPHICCFHTRGKFFKVIADSGIPIHIKKTTHQMIPRLSGLKKTFYLASYFKCLGIDIIHSFHYGDDYSEALAARLARIPWVYTKKNMNWGGKSKRSWLLRTFLSKHILVQNTEMFKFFAKNSDKVTLVPRGVDTKEFYPRKPNSKILNQFKINKNDNVLICVANLHPVKGIEILIDAFLKLSKKYNPIHLFIVGFKSNKYGKSLEKKIEKGHKKNNIYFLGKVDNVKDFLSVSNLFILPTLNIKRKEGCPVAILEALASGLKVLGSDVCGINNILSDFPENLFEPGNIDELKRKIEIQLSQEDKHLSKRLLNHTIKNYDITVESKRHEEIYLKISNEE